MKRALLLLILLMPLATGLAADKTEYIQGELATISGAKDLVIYSPHGAYRFLGEYQTADFSLDSAGTYELESQAATTTIEVLPARTIIQEQGKSRNNIQAGIRDNGEILIRQEGFEEIVLHDFSGDTLRLDTTTPTYGMKDTFAVDPTTPGFTSATITKIAKAPTLRKCTEYNYEKQTCTGEWSVIRRLAVGEPYTLLVSGADPIFGESDSESEPDSCSFSDDAGAGDGDAGANCLSEVQTLDDGTTADLEDPEQGGGPSEISITFTNTLSIESVSSIDVTYRYQRLTNTEVAGTSATIQVFDAGAWTTACTDTVSIGSWENYTCDLSTWVTSQAEANNVQTRIQFDTGKSAKGDSEGLVYVDNAYLSMDYVYLDLIPPKYSAVQATPASPKTYDENNVTFNTNWTDDVNVDTVQLEHNFTGAFQNETLTGGEQYSYSHNLSAGTYQWRMYANDTSGNQNQTPMQTYTVNKATGSVQLLINETNGNYEINEDTTIPLNGTRLAGETELALYENGVLIAQGDEIDLNRFYGTPGTYVLTLNMSESQNYTFDEEEYTLTVNDITPPQAVTNLQNQTADVSWIYWNWTNPPNADFSHVIVEVNGTFFANVSTNYYNATGLTADTEYEVQLRTVDTSGNINETTQTDTARTAISLDVDPPKITSITNTSITDKSADINWETDENSDSLVKYGTATGTHTQQAYDSSDVTAHSITLTGLLPATTYYYVVNSTDPSENTNQSNEYTFTTLVDATPPKYSLIESDPAGSATYGTAITLNTTWNDNGALANVLIEHNFTGNWQNETMSGGAEYTYQTTPGAGNYQWRSIANDTQGNLNNSMPYQTYTVNQATGAIQLELDGTQDNISVNEDLTVNLTATRITGEGTLEIIENQTVLATGNNPLTHLKNYGQPGTYLITARLNETQNYTQAQQNYTLTVQDTTPPTVTLGAPFDGKTSTDSAVIFEYTPTDNVHVTSCSLYIEDTLNQTNNTITGATINTFTVSFEDGAYNWTIECQDEAGNAQNSTTWNFQVSIIHDWIPTIATHNIDGTVTGAVNQTGGTITRLDEDEFVTTTAWSEVAPSNANITALSANCEIDRAERGATLNFQYDTGAGFSGDICTQPTNGVATFSCDLYAQGVDTPAEMNNLQVRCVIRDTNGGSAANADMDYMFLDPEWTLIELPNFYAVQGSFGYENAVEGGLATIFANVTNNGTVGSSVTLRFIDSTRDKQVANVTGNVGAGSTEQFNASWRASIGATEFLLAADPDDTVNEMDETDNNATGNVNVSAWHIYYGEIEQGFKLLGTDVQLTFNWTNDDVGNILVIDGESDVDLLNLKALTRTTSDAYAFADLEEADSKLGMTAFSDSINSTYSSGGTLRGTKTYRVAGEDITDVPVRQSTNSTSFRTGIMYDANDDTNGGYDGEEDLVFITETNTSQAGAYGTYDYEIRIPALLRNDSGVGSTVSLFFEVN